MQLIDKIDKSNVPNHIAVIMDGNGRWAKQRNLDRTEGHRKGVESVRTIMRAASKIGIKYVTLYTFSTENWNRPKEEVDALMELMIHAVMKETAELVENGIRLQVIGDIDRLPAKTRKALDECLDATSKGDVSTVILALSYSARWEIIKATKQIAKDASLHKIDLDNLSEDIFDNYLTTKSFPDPDLLIRTGGEKRISNFLLWQIAYSELIFTDELWPDFSEDSLFATIIEYQQRERRFGKTSEQLEQL